MWCFALCGRSMIAPTMWSGVCARTGVCAEMVFTHSPPPAAREPPPGGSLSGRFASAAGASPPPYHGNGVCARTEAPMHKPRLCPYGARGAVRVMRLGFAPRDRQIYRVLS